jgi:hypothetical protein
MIPKYKIIDFKGYVFWCKRDDGLYAVNPLYVDKFLKFKGEPAPILESED